MSIPPRAVLQYDRILDMLPLQVRNRIYANAEIRSYKKGDYVYHENDKGPYYLGCLKWGRLRASVTSHEGKEFLLAMVEKGEMFGEMSVFDSSPRPLDMIAEQESAVMILQGEDIYPHLLASPEAIKQLLTLSGRRMRAYLRRMELLALQTVKQKLGRHLIHSARDFGRDPDEKGYILIDRPQNQADIGLLLGVSRESINKQIQAFVAAGLILYDSERITLCDVEALKKAIASGTE
jgi:CRP/FNR family transcriptional regulator, cyclic AMP receptor protein